jgi:small-conductance mechanosensitive channel
MKNRAGGCVGYTALVAVALAFAAAALAQAPAMPAGAAPDVKAVAADAATDFAALRQDKIRALAAAMADLDTLEAGGSAVAVPPGVPASEAADRRSAARQLVTAYQQQVDTLERAEASRAERAQAERADREWQGFDTPLPLSVLVVDAIRDSVESAQSRLTGTATRRTMLDRFAADIEPKLKASQAAARQAAEAADAARGTPRSVQLEWARDLTALRARADVATRELIALGTRTVREEAGAAQATLDLARRQLAAAGGQFTLSVEDLARVDADIDARRRATERDIARAAKAAVTATEARIAAEQRLAEAGVARPGEDAAALALRRDTAAADAMLAREQAATATQRAELLRDTLVVLAGERMAWDARSESLKSHDPLRARAAYERLASSLTVIRARRDFLNQELATVATRIGEAETRLRRATEADAAYAEELLATFRVRESELREALKRGQPLERLVARFQSDLEGQRSSSLYDQARDLAAGALLQARRVWNYEMFTVDDSYETADGRKLNVARGVTVGKTIGAALIVIVGYLFFRLLFRLLERVAVRSGRMAPQAAALLRSWALFFVTAALVIFALTTASIPITVFAFMGGALAIAAGFGLQTLLKNLVAGIILLLERPMRLGDLVDVDGIRGRVTQIGIRASTILTADGMESLIPNSSFLENKLTNWTYTSPQARQSVTIGVAYGTPLRDAADVLEGVLARYGLVLKDRVRIEAPSTSENASYLETKRTKLGHLFAV